MSCLDEKILELGKKKEFVTLQKLISSVDTEELKSLIKDKLTAPRFEETWNCILQAFTDNSGCHQKRFNVCMMLLKELEERDIQTSRRSSLVTRTCMELTKFKSEHLVELCVFCLECIQSKKVTHMAWKDLLPELLNVLSERENFEHNEIEYTGKEYRSEFINTLCMVSWPPNVVTALAAAFMDTALTKEEHLKVVNKLGTCMEKLTPQEVPTFVYHMLKLCKHQNGRYIFFRLQNYFGIRLYDNKSYGSVNSDSTNFDSIESSNEQDTVQAESTVLYHIHSSATLGHNCIKDYLNVLKLMQKTPVFVLNPFHLMVLFTISTIPHYEETVFEIIRPAIVRSFHEDQKKVSSCWFRDTMTYCCKPEEILRRVIDLSLEERELVIQSSVNFAFALLNIGSALGRDVIAEKQWKLGTMILLKIIKRRRNIAPVIMQMLGNNIVTRQSATQYITCLYILSRSMPLLMIENQSCIVELMDSLVQVPATVANQLLDAIIPLVRVSPTIRDHLILLLRKALFSRVLDSRCMAVNGLLKLLTNMKISNLAVLSQSNSSSSSFSSGHSLFTQISLNRSSQSMSNNYFSNEALCLEVLGILRRCFMQQESVRAQLYEGLYDAVCSNPELGIPVLDVIYLHLSNYLATDDTTLPPLDFKKVAALRETDCPLQEPLGKLIFSVALILWKVRQNEEERDNPTVIKFTKLMDSLCENMANCELVHLELDDGTDLGDVLPECQQKVHILQEAMNVYEALIGYKIVTWESESEFGIVVNNLYQGYSRLCQFSRIATKPKKSKKPENKTQNTQPSNSTFKKPESHGKAIKNIKIPDTILNLQVVEKALKLLLKQNGDWESESEVNKIRTKSEIHKHFIQAAITLVANYKNIKSIDESYKKSCFEHITKIACIIYERVVKRFSEFVDFDCGTAVLALDCFHNILVLISKQFENNFECFLAKVGDKSREDGIVQNLTPFIEIYQKLFETDEDDLSGDPEIKRLHLIAASTLIVLSEKIPNDSNTLSVQMCEWLKKIAHNNALSSKVSIVFMNLMFDVHIKYKISLNLHEQVSSALGKVIGVISEEENEHDDEFQSINEATGTNTILAICNSIKNILDDIDSVIVSFKSDNCMVNFSGQESLEKRVEQQKNKEKSVTCHLCFVVSIISNLANLGVNAGNISEAIFKSVMCLYSTLSQLTKNFIMRSSKTNLVFQQARFERLVKLAGKQLAPIVYRFIMHVEESQKHENQTQAKKKSVDTTKEKSRVLRETRLIPKVIYEIEQFSKAVIQLSNKTKCDLAKHVGQGTVRDFRIMHIKEILKNAGDNVAQTQESEANTSGTSEATENETDKENNDSRVMEDDSDNDSSPPPSKRSRV